MHPLHQRLLRSVRRRSFRRPVAIAALAALVLIPIAVVTARRLRPPRDPLPAARLLLASGDAAAAEAHVRNAVALRPRDAAAWYLLGECLRARGRGDDATGASRRAHVLAPDWDAPVVALASASLADGRAAEARRLVDESVRRGTGTAPLLRLRARMRRTAADFAGAADDLEAAAKRQGGRARDLLEAASLRRSAEFVSGIDDPRYESLLDEAERRVSDDDASTDDVTAALRAERGVVPDSAIDGPLDEQALRNLLAFDRAGKQENARALSTRLSTEIPEPRLRHAAAALPPQDTARLSALLAHAPDGTEDQLDAHEANAHLAAARRADARRHDLLTVAHLRALALLRPHDPDVAFALGMRLGRDARADAVLDVATRLPGGAAGPAARRLLGWYHVGAGEPLRAAPYLLGPDRAPDARIAAAIAQLAVRQPNDVASAARAAVLRQPDDALPRLLLGLVAGHRDDAATACVHHTAALARDPSLAVAANDLAWWLATRGDVPAYAEPLALWAAFLAPNDPHVRHTEIEVRRRLRADLPHPERNSR